MKTTKAQLAYRAQKFIKRCPACVLVRNGETYTTKPCSLPLTHNGACVPAPAVQP